MEDGPAFSCTELSFGFAGGGSGCSGTSGTFSSIFNLVGSLGISSVSGFLVIGCCVFKAGLAWELTVEAGDFLPP